MPYIGNNLFIPKPIISMNVNRESDSKLKKKFKKLKYILIENMTEYLNGNFNPKDTIKMFDDFGKSDIRTSVSVNEITDNKPFNIGIYSFKDGNGLYFIATYKNKDILDYLDILIESLSFSGIGGKRSSGLGKFEYTYEDISDETKKRLENNFDTYMSLSVSMAKEDVKYELIKRNGFISSENYSNTYMKKMIFTVLKAVLVLKVSLKVMYLMFPTEEIIVYTDMQNR